MKRALSALLVAASLAGCAAQTRETGRMLRAAGFQVVPSPTAEGYASPGTVTARTLVAQQRNGQPYYVYVDDRVCRCLYVGDEQAYREYQWLQAEKQIAASSPAARRSVADFASWKPFAW